MSVADTLERLDNKLDEVDSLIIELGLNKKSQVALCTKIYDLWAEVETAVEKESKLGVDKVTE